MITESQQIILLGGWFPVHFLHRFWSRISDTGLLKPGFRIEGFTKSQLFGGGDVFICLGLIYGCFSNGFGEVFLIFAVLETGFKIDGFDARYESRRRVPWQAGASGLQTAKLV